MAQARQQIPAGKRSPRGWRIPLALICLALAWQGTASALANAIARSDPQTAYSIFGRDGRIMARLAERRFEFEPTAELEGETGLLAMRALERDPTAAKALVTLGSIAALHGSNARAKAAFGHANLLSYRELRPRLWAIEDAASRGDIDGALGQFDIALRNSKTVQETLFPILAAAAGQSQVRPRIIALLQRGQDWRDDYLYFLTSRAPVPQVTVPFLAETEKAGIPLSPSAKATLVDRLVEIKQYELAWQTYRSMHGSVARDAIRNGSFSDSPQDMTVFDWVVGGSGDLHAFLADRGNPAAFEFSAGPSASGVILQQFQMLEPGTYRLKGRAIVNGNGQSGAPYWTFRCLNGFETQRLEIGAQPSVDGRFSGVLTIPVGCSPQNLALMLPRTRSTERTEGRVFEIEISPF